MTNASGANVSLRYVRELTRGVTPAGVGTPVTDLAAVATGTKFTRPSGSFITDGFKAGQYVKTEGFTTTDNNGTWLITSVSALEIVVDDPGTLISDETTDAAQVGSILLQDLRATSRAVNPTKATLASAEVRADRQRADVRHGFEQVAGAPGFELSREAYDDMLEALMGRAWTEVLVTGAPDFGAHASGYFERDAGSFITDGFRVGDIIRTASFSDSVNNGDWRVTGVTALQLTVDTGSLTLITDPAASGPTLTYPGKRLDVGSVLETLTFERRFSDVSQYQPFSGVTVNQMQLSVQPEAIVGGSFTLLGMIAAAMSASPLSAEDPRAAAQNSPYAAFDGGIHEGGTTIAVATGVDFTVNNNRQLAAVIGSKTSPDVFEGTMECTGTLTAFFQDATLFNKFIGETESTLFLKLLDVVDSSHFMSIVFPRVKYTGGDMDPPQEGPVPLSMPFQALVKTDLAAASGATIASTLTFQRSNA